MTFDTKAKRQYEYVKDYVLFDLETTGISPMTDQVIEISAVKVKNGKVVEAFSSLVNPGRRIPPAASAVNGITDVMVKRERTFDLVLKDFLDFAGDYVLVGHNIHAFDMKFIVRDAKKYLNREIENCYVDTLTMARQRLPQLKHHKLVDLAEYYGISSEGAHRALNDCRMNQAVFEKLAKEKNVKTSRTNASKVKTSTTKASTEKTGSTKTSSVKPKKVCPRCDMALVKRSGMYGQFWGCTGFPNCRYTENIY